MTQRLRPAALAVLTLFAVLAGCAAPAGVTGAAPGQPAAQPGQPAAPTAGVRLPAVTLPSVTLPAVTRPGARPAAPAPAAAPAAPQGPIVIRDNRGGNVVQMMAYRQQLAASGRPVEIRGLCNSACTMLVTLPNACLAPDATVGFHAPRLPNTQVIPPIVDQLMATTYRNGIRARWFNEWRHSLSIQSITAREYVALDPMTRLCPR